MDSSNSSLFPQYPAMRRGRRCGCGRAREGRRSYGRSRRPGRRRGRRVDAALAVAELAYLEGRPSTVVQPSRMSLTTCMRFWPRTTRRPSCGTSGMAWPAVARCGSSAEARASFTWRTRVRRGDRGAARHRSGCRRCRCRRRGRRRRAPRTGRGGEAVLGDGGQVVLQRGRDRRGLRVGYPAQHRRRVHEAVAAVLRRLGRLGREPSAGVGPRLLHDPLQGAEQVVGVGVRDEFLVRDGVPRVQHRELREQPLRASVGTDRVVGGLATGVLVRARFLPASTSEVARRLRSHSQGRVPSRRSRSDR